MTVGELVLMMLQEVKRGEEVSSTGLIIHSLHTLESAVEKALTNLQMQDIVSKRWKEETNMLVYKRHALLPDEKTFRIIPSAKYERVIAEASNMEEHTNDTRTITLGDS